MRSGSVSLLLLGLLAAAAVPVADAASAAAPTVEVPGAATSVQVDAARGELEDAQVVVHGARGRLSVHLSAGAPALLQQGLSVLRLATTEVDGRAVADPLPPLARRATVQGGEDVTLVLRFLVARRDAARHLREPARVRVRRTLVRNGAGAPARLRRVAAGT